MLLHFCGFKRSYLCDDYSIYRHRAGRLMCCQQSAVSRAVRKFIDEGSRLFQLKLFFTSKKTETEIPKYRNNGKFKFLVHYFLGTFLGSKILHDWGIYCITEAESFVCFSRNITNTRSSGCINNDFDFNPSSDGFSYYFVPILLFPKKREMVLEKMKVFKKQKR